jgi:hypothetical protein
MNGILHDTVYSNITLYTECNSEIGLLYVAYGWWCMEDGVGMG